MATIGHFASTLGASRLMRNRTCARPSIAVAACCRPRVIGRSPWKQRAHVGQRGRCPNARQVRYQHLGLLRSCLPPDLRPLLVSPLAQELCMSQAAAGRPLDEANLHHERRLDRRASDDSRRRRLARPNLFAAGDAVGLLGPGPQRRSFVPRSGRPLECHRLSRGERSCLATTGA
jgi:hypothetical protein